MVPATPSNDFWRYNIIQGCADRPVITTITGYDTSWLCATNRYWNSENEFLYGGGPTFTAWSAYASGVWAGSVLQEIGSTFSVTPPTPAVGGYNDPANGDLSRPNSSQEIDVTYGGVRWTRIGAWQPTAALTEKTKASGTITVPSGLGGINFK